MTTNTHDVQRKQVEHDAINADLQTYLDSGKMIEILGPTPVKHHHPRDYQYASDKS